MITHFSVVNACFKSMEEISWEPLIEIIDPDHWVWDDEDMETVARGLFYMLTRLKFLATQGNGNNPGVYEAWKDNVTQRAVEEEIRFIFEEDSGD